MLRPIYNVAKKRVNESLMLVKIRHNIGKIQHFWQNTIIMVKNHRIIQA